MDNLPTVSIIIPTYNSEKVIGSCLKALISQSYPKNKFEIIVVDNYSKDRTVSISKNFGVKVFQLKGVPSQGCAQRNLGAEKAEFEFLFFLDHDMELSRNLLTNFAKKVWQTKNKIDAWYVPERVVGKGEFLTKIRTFEREFYNSTPIDAARIIKKVKFDMTEKYDPKLSSGPADWDMDLQLKEIGCKFGIIDECVYHHEELMSLWKYLTKKTRYVNGSLIYQEKWKKRSEKTYKDIVSKQYNAYYRLIGVFFENGKWKKVAENSHLYFALIFIRLGIGLMYFLSRIKQ